MSKVNLECLVGNRFSDVDNIISKLTKLGAKDPQVFISESDKVEGQDDMLEGCLNTNPINDEENHDFSLFYIKTNENKYYITEVNQWG